jgi:DNA-binding MarR family transcriptional regulator/ribosomal protein S18 acetylase RimI-like enzyme
LTAATISLTLTTVSAVDDVRAFNRFYTRAAGLLRGGLHRTDWSLAEARVMFELAQRPATEVSDLRRALDVDAGHLSRVLARLERAGVVEREPSPGDRRRQTARLTDAGREAFAELDRAAAEEAGELLSGLDDRARRELAGAMGTIRTLLGDPSRDGRPAIVLRDAEPGDLGWIVELHGRVYAAEYGWDATFEALVARICADFAEQRRPGRDAVWIAEVDGRRSGCVMCVRQDDRTAKLRLLLVDPAARGLGLGTRLVDECVRFAGRAGYEELVLWTNDVLTAARRIYERAGFELAASEPHHSFGHDLVGQTWRLQLR